MSFHAYHHHFQAYRIDKPGAARSTDLNRRSHARAWREFKRGCGEADSQSKFLAQNVAANDSGTSTCTHRAGSLLAASERNRTISTVSQRRKKRLSQSNRSCHHSSGQSCGEPV